MEFHGLRATFTIQAIAASIVIRILVGTAGAACSAVSARIATRSAFGWNA
jgi:hypothetical protein